MKIENYLLNIILLIRFVCIPFKKTETTSLPALMLNGGRTKKRNLIKFGFFIGITMFQMTSYGQNIVPFTKRYNQQVKGDMLVIGNNTLGKSNAPLNDNSVNENTVMQFIDIDSEDTFSSSSANLAIPPATTCFRVVYAGLYWGALIKGAESRANITNVKLKLPGVATYSDITGTIIRDTPAANAIVPDANRPYACYADVTALLSGLTNAQGTYTVANVSSSIGSNGTTGLSAGWTLVVVYEDPTATTKSITTFDGFSALFDSSSLDIDVSGFITPPSPTQIDIKFGFAALNGDRTSNNKVEVGNTRSNGEVLKTAERGDQGKPFFNSSITDINGYLAPRNPNNINSLGYDTGVVFAADQFKIGNDKTSAVVSLQIPRGQANPLFSFFNSFLINVVAPDISLTKIVQNAAGQDVGNTTINLGQDLYYKIDFQNIGNDQITAFTLVDVLPNNVIFNYPSDIVLPLPAGVTHTYDAVARRLVFTIPDALVTIGGLPHTIRLHVKVVSDYNLLRDACSNEIKNQAFANYRGVVNTTPVVGEGSFASTVCNFGSPSSTNFLANIDGHTFTRTQVLCGNSVVLSASNGYNSYSWSTSPSGSPVISTSQTYTATSTGTYYVNSVSNSTCKSIKEEITVIPFGNTITNPVTPYANEVVTCPNNGKDLPNIFLCGATATRLIQTNITDASSIEWQKLNEATCPSTAIANCANETFANSCWNTVATGQNYAADTAGQFRVVLKYSGGCQSIFYFNVFKNTLNPTVATNDIICTTKGNITVGGVPSGYEYSLDKVTYQASNIFTINTAGTYTVYIRQVGVTTNPCIFEVKDILIRLRNFTVSKITTQPLCNGGLGSIRLVANDVRSQYFFSISKGGSPVNSVGPILANEATFSNLSSGVYTYEVRTEDGCIETGTIELFNPAALTATSALTKPLTCANGEITVYPVGGTPPYRYFVNSTTVSQTVPQIVVSKPLPAGGVFNITVVDLNNCSTTTSITVAEVPKPVYTVTKTDINCYGANSGEIRFNVASANGYSLRYSINNGTSYSTNPTFSNLPPGAYTPVLEYSLSGQVCTEVGTPITIVEPASAVTASGGVSKLAGCTLSNQGGTIRFSNVSGGTPGYTYSFDGGATFGTATEKDVLPGSYTLVAKDSKGCTFTVPYPVVLDPIPTAPTILVDTASFNCDGTGTTTVTVTNPSNLNYTYEYLIDGVLNTNTADPKVFLNVPSGSHVVTVKYKLVSVSTFSTLLEENFGSGNPTTTPGIASAYCFNDQRVVGPYPCGQRSVEDNEYSVASFFWRSDDPSSTNVGAWFNFKDHTTNGTDPKGRFLLVNIGDAAGNYGVLYSKPIFDVIPNQPLNVEVYLANLLRAGVNGANPDFIIELVDPLGTVVASQFTGIIAGSPTSPDRNKWVFKQLSLNPGNNTNLTFRIKSGSILYNGNDALIDDIRVYQLPETCIAKKDFPIEVPTGKAFEAQIAGSKNITCFGLTNGEITIAAQNFNASTGFQYSINNGATWFTTTTSPVTVSGLSANTYSVLVRPNSSSASVCTKTFSVPITAPTAVTASASIIMQATCSTGATIRAVGGGGTPAYQYELRQANGITVVTAFNNNPDFTNVPVGSYTVFVRDANACTNATGVPVTVNAPPTLTATLNASTDYCYTVANPATLVVNVSGGVGPFTYKLDSNASISSALTTFSFANVTPGTHTIVVTDSNNCTSTISNIVIAPALTLNLSLVKDLTCPDDASIGNPEITGGYGTPYTYTVSHNSGTPTAVASFPYTATVAGTYVFTVSDSKGCPATSNTITVTPKTTPTHTTVKTDSTCNGSNNGTITVTASGGFTTTYTYAIKVSLATTYTTQTTNQFTGLAAGTYDIKVIDSKGCESTPSQVTIINPTPIATNATATAFKCSTTNANQSATITVVPTGGTGTYTYSYNNGVSYGPSSTLTVNDNGTTQPFQIIVKDANGCLSPMQPIVLAPLNRPTNLDFSNAVITCTATTTTVSVTATNAVGALTFLITGTTSGTNPSFFGPITTAGSSVAASFPNLLPGNYTFKVTDANGCYYSESYTIAPVTPIVATATKLTDVDCRGNTTGSIRYGVSGFGSGTYSYTVNGGSPVAGTASTFTLPNLGANTYVVVFTDNATGCTASTSITINQPAAALSASYTTINANCNVPTSSVTVTVAGGTPSYRYSFVTLSTTPGTYGTSNTANLNPTTSTSWYAHIIDANNCTFVLPITIAKDPIPTVTASATGQCLGSGSYTITASGLGGVGTLSYSINGGASYQPGNTFVVTTAGNYTITVKDGNGCTNTSNVITVNPQLTLSAVLNKNITCSSPAAAQITLTPTGGSGPYSYEYKEAAGFYTTMPSNVFNTSTLGSYTFKVTDVILCQAVTTTAIVLTAPIDPDITGVTQTAFINCNGDDTAAISIAIDNTKGQSPFVFNVTRTTPTVFNYGTQTSGLSAGDYVVTETDAKGCTDTFNINIPEPSAIIVAHTSTPITCDTSTGQSKGSVIVQSVTGGVGPYNYFVTGVNGYSNSELNNLGTMSVAFNVVDFGLYQINVVDFNGCSVLIQNVPVESPPDDLDISVVPVGPTCVGLGSAEVAIGVASSITGTGPFHFAVYSPGLTYTGPTSPPWYDEDSTGSKKATIPNLIPGVTYTFIVHDAFTGCYYFETADVPIPTNSTITVNPLIPNNITCKGAADGNVTFTMNHVYGVSTPVTYQVYNSQSVTPVGSAVSATIPASGSLVVSNFGMLPFGNYFVLVTEDTGATNAGCSISSAPFNITESAIDLSITAQKIKKINCNEDGIIAAFAKDGTAPYTYQYLLDSVTAPVASSSGWITNTTFATSVAGNYIVYVKDEYGCIKSAPITLDADAAPTVIAPASICYQGNPFTITFSGTVDPALVGAPTYSINGSAFQSSPSFTFNASGTYNLVIKDGNGCTATVNYVVYPQLVSSAVLSKPLECTTTPDAIITLNTSGGNPLPAPTYTYEVSYNGGVNVAATNPYTATAAGTYVFTITDANNATACTTTASITLDPIPSTVFNTTQTAVSCNGGADGTITVTVTAGEGPFEYQLDSATFQPSNVFTGLSAGSTYVVTVRNARQCLVSSGPITISEPALLTATAGFTANTTCSPTTLITVIPDGGNGGYLFNFNSLGYTTANTYTVNNLTTPTTVRYTVKDAKGCETGSQSVTTPALNPPTDMTFISTPIYCAPPSSTTSTVTITTTNGVGTLTYAILSPATATSNTTGASSGVFSSLAPADYMFKVTDANGCTYQELYTVAPRVDIAVAVTTITDETCFNTDNGTATFTVANSTGYTATLTAGTGTPVIVGNTVTLTALTPGNYTLQVVDTTTGCTADVPFVIGGVAQVLDFTSTATNTNCTTDIATITVVASGGTVNYTYVAVIAGSTVPAASAYGSSNTLVVDTNAGVNMDWDVYVMDANGCFITKPQTIVLDASPVITLVEATQCPSPTGTYTITVTATGFSTALQYSAGGDNFQTGNVITVNAPGTYTISVKDANGCLTTAAPVTILDPLILTPTVTTSPSCTDGDGVIAVATTGGSGNYQYRIDSGVYPMTTPFIGIASGTHTIYVRDTTTGCEVNRIVTLQPATLITGFSLNTTPVTCNGGTDGTITATLATPASGINDNPVYTYTLNGTTVGGAAVSRPSQNSPVFSGLAAGTYTVVVTSGRACTDTQTINVVEPTVLVVPAPTVVEFGCTTGNTGNLATITVTGVTGGTTPYLNYEFIKIGTPNTQVQFSSNNVYTEANLSGGSYLVKVYDSKGCIGTTTAPITIAPYVALDKVNVVVDQAITCSNLENITVTATIVGGTAPNLQYTLVDTNATSSTTGTLYPSQTNTTGIFTNLPVADYLITVRNVDTNCEIKGVHYVNEPNTFDLTIDAVVDVTCFGGTNGSANVTFVDRVITTTPPNGDGAGAFTYTLQDALGNPLPGGTSPNAGPYPITGLPAGTYTITATLSQSPDCAVTRNFTIAGPSAALDITETHTEITCVAGNNDGSISVSASGGWSGGYEYQLLLNGTEIVAYGAQTQFTNLTAGNYTVNVRDSKGCVDTVSRTLVNPTPIAITATPATQTLTCFGDKTASIQATGVSGGQGANYLYTLNYLSLTPVVSSGPQASGTFSGLGVGNYSITVTDGWNCSATSATVAVTEPTEVQSALVVSRSQTCTTLSQLTLSARGGTPPYTYSADDITYSTIPFASSISFDVPVDTYRYFVKDFNGCVAAVSNDIEIVPLEPLLPNINVDNAVILCKDGFTGVIVADATGGLGNYTYTLLNGSGVVLVPAPTQLTPGRFTNLGVGFYQVRVDSGDCNEVSAVKEITEPTQAVAYTVNKTDVTCNGENNGRIDVVGSGGTGKIIYSISDRNDQFFDDGVFENLAPGNYEIIIQDQNGCYEPYNFQINEPPLLFGTLQPGSLMPEVCSGDNDGAFSITVAGGVAPYSVSLDTINGPYTQGAAGQTDFDFTNLVGGPHKVYIKDASNCPSELEVIMPDAVLINPKAAVSYDCVNNTQANKVVVTYDASNDATDLDFDLDGLGNYQASNTFNNVAPGQHFITVRHSNGCVQSTLRFTVDQVDPLVLVIADGDLNQIKATATGGSGVYEYSFNGEDFTTQSTYAIYKSGNYTVIVRDKNGCTATANRDFTYIDICIPNYFTPNGDGNLDEWAPGCTNNYPDLSFSIFDRYGRVIAKYRIGQKWDGKYKGEELPSGDYWYTLKLNNNKDDREFVGHFTLYR